MDIVTIACPTAMTHPEVDPTSAPVWVDADGNEYRVTSGIVTADADPAGSVARPDRITVLSGPAGLEALAMMGLTQKEAPGV